MKNVKLFITMGLMLTLAFVSCSKDNNEEGGVGEPSIDFSYTPETPGASTAISFTAITNQGSSRIVSWRWSFGNSTGSTSTEQDPTFTYNEEGTFEVELEGTDISGVTATVTKSITVGADPEFDFPAELAWTLEDATNIGNYNDATKPLVGDDGVVYYVIGGTSSSASKLVAVTDAGSSAQVKWSWTGGFGLRAAPSMGADGNLYQTGWHVDNTVNKINSANGSPLWGVAANNSGSSNSTPAIDADGNIYVASRFSANNGGIFSYNSDGDVRWSVLAVANTGIGATYSSPAISSDGSTVYFYSTAQGYVRAYNTADGEEKWAVKTEGTGLGTSVSIDADGTIYITNDTEVVAVTDNGTSGSIKWTAGSLLEPNSSGVVIGGNGDLYVGTKEALVALDPASGSVIWTYPTFMFECVPAVDNNGNVYFGNNEGKFLIVNTDGVLQREFTVGGGDAIVHSPVIADNGDVYVEVSDSGLVKLCKITVEDGGPANSPWPMKGQNRKHTSQAL